MMRYDGNLKTWYDLEATKWDIQMINFYDQVNGGDISKDRTQRRYYNF